jgi:hypothetical protein
MGMMDKKVMNSSTGATAPKKASSSDMSGERREKMVGGVAMGMMDKTGKDSQFNTGRSEGVCYTHDRSCYK